MRIWRPRLEREDEWKRPRIFHVAATAPMPSVGDVLLVNPEGDAIRVQAVDATLRAVWWVPEPSDEQPLGARSWDFPPSGAHPATWQPSGPVPEPGFERTVPSPVLP